MNDLDEYPEQTNHHCENDVYYMVGLSWHPSLS